MKPYRPLLSLVAFCTASVLIASLGFVVIFAGATVALTFAQTWSGARIEVAGTAQASTDPPGQDTAVDAQNAIIFEGVISDDHCQARHDMGSGKSPAECTRICTREGGHYVVINGNKMYRLAGRDDLTMLAGERVTVTGSLTGDTIKIQSINRE